MTTNQTERVPDEELDQMIWKLGRDGGMAPKLLSLMRELREVRRGEGEPVAYADPSTLSNFEARSATREWMWATSDTGLIPLYIVPKVPEMPDEMAISDDMNLYQKSFAQGHNACRAAMLNHQSSNEASDGKAGRAEIKQPSSNSFTNAELEMMSPGDNPQANAYRELLAFRYNSPVTPDGWVMVPVEPTEGMVIAGFEFEPDEFFSEEEDWAAYETMSGCQQAAHRAKLCYAAMLAAAPKEVGR